MFKQDIQAKACWSAARRGDLVTIKRLFNEMHDVIVRQNMDHFKRNLLRSGLTGGNRFAVLLSWFEGHRIDYIIASMIVRGGHVDVIRWLFASEQLVLVGETLRAITNTAMGVHFRPLTKLSLEVIEIMMESALFKDNMDDDEQFNLLARLLEIAIVVGEPCWTDTLLAYGANPEFICANGSRPIDMLGRSLSTATVALLLDHGVLLENVPLPTYCHPMMSAMLRGGAEHIEFARMIQLSMPQRDFVLINKW